MSLEAAGGATDDEKDAGTVGVASHRWLSRAN
jgi:hypothetical protein